MAGVLVLVWGIHYCLSVMHPAQAREWLWRRKLLSTHLEGYTRQSCPAHIHLLQGLEPPIFTATPPRYFPSCFPLAFLEGRYTSLSPAAISLHLDPAIWDPLAPSNRAASSSSTSSQSHWRYSNVLFFFFSSSTTFYFSAFSLAFFSTSLLAFWAVYLASPLPQVKAGAAAPLCVSTTFPATAFLRFWRRFVKCQRGWKKTWWYRNKSKKLSFLFMYCWSRYYYRIFR